MGVCVVSPVGHQVGLNIGAHGVHGVIQKHGLHLCTPHAWSTPCALCCYSHFGMGLGEI